MFERARECRPGLWNFAALRAWRGGVRPGMIVAVMGRGRGYYTRILAKAVGSTGKVYAIVTTAQAARPGGLDALNALAAAYPNIKLVTVDYPTMMLPFFFNDTATTEN